MNELYQQHFKEDIHSISLLPVSGSYRKYYRISSANHHCLGVENTDIKENEAFINYTNQFKELGLNVPEILAISEDKKHYLIEDLGDTTLYAFLTEERQNNGGIFTQRLFEIYRRVIKLLLQFQIQAGKDFDYSKAYPREAFDKQSMLWDLNYFKYYFLKLARVSFDEQALENDFKTFSNYLLSVPSNYFLYRDFQSRNIMLFDGDIYFIDYQGGRKGSLHYDLASLLYDAKADIPNDVRRKLLDDYIIELSHYQTVDAAAFKKEFYAFVFIRIMQAMGSYGFRGFYEKKEHFLKSIPLAIDNIEYLLKTEGFPVELPELKRVFKQIINNQFLRTRDVKSSDLCVEINSFSFKKGYPTDNSGHGGGFVFDCRALPNPGRYEEYKHQTGKDREVILFFEKHHEVADFIEQAYLMIKPSIENYIQRNFSHLQVNFGCTGGQHRSVYCAEKLFYKIFQEFDIQLNINHKEQSV